MSNGKYWGTIVAIVVPVSIAIASVFGSLRADISDAGVRIATMEVRVDQLEKNEVNTVELVSDLKSAINDMKIAVSNLKMLEDQRQKGAWQRNHAIAPNQP